MHPLRELTISAILFDYLSYFLGGAIFVHAFGAYFGLAVSMVHRRRNTGSSEPLEGSLYASDIFAMVFRNHTCLILIKRLIVFCYDFIFQCYYYISFQN